MFVIATENVEVLSQRIHGAYTISRISKDLAQPWEQNVKLEVDCMLEKLKFGEGNRLTLVRTSNLYKL